MLKEFFYDDENTARRMAEAFGHFYPKATVSVDRREDSVGAYWAVTVTRGGAK